MLWTIFIEAYRRNTGSHKVNSATSGESVTLDVQPASGLLIYFRG
jgi:hypothetical protein